MKWEAGKDLMEYYREGVLSDVLPYDLVIEMGSSDLKLTVRTTTGLELAVCAERLRPLLVGDTLTIQGLPILLPIKIEHK